MKKRDIVILLVLIAMVVAFSAWEKINERERDAEQARARRTERAELEKRLTRYNLSLDSLSTMVLHFIDSLKMEAAFFDSMARETPLDVAAGDRPAELLAHRGAESAPTDTLPRLVRSEYDRALARLPADLTKYEKKIATKEVENTIRARFRLSEEEFNEMKKSWAAADE